MPEPAVTDTDRVMDVDFTPRLALTGTEMVPFMVLQFGGLKFRVQLTERDRLDLIRGLAGVGGSVPLRCELQPSRVPAEHFVREGYVILDGETLNARRPIE